MMTNSSFTPEFDTLTVCNNILPKFEMKLNNVASLPTQLSFSRTFYQEMISNRILSYHSHKFRVYINYDRNYSPKFNTVKVEVLTDNGWKQILSKCDINWDGHLNDKLFYLEGEDQEKLNEITNDIEENFIKLICLLY